MQDSENESSESDDDKDDRNASYHIDATQDGDENEDSSDHRSDDEADEERRQKLERPTHATRFGRDAPQDTRDINAEPVLGRRASPIANKRKGKTASTCAGRNGYWDPLPGKRLQRKQRPPWNYAPDEPCVFNAGAPGTAARVQPPQSYCIFCDQRQMEDALSQIRGRRRVIKCLEAYKIKNESVYNAALARVPEERRPFCAQTVDNATAASSRESTLPTARSSEPHVSIRPSSPRTASEVEDERAAFSARSHSLATEIDARQQHDNRDASHEASAIERFERSMQFALDPKPPLQHMMWNFQVKQLRVGRTPCALSPTLAIWNTHGDEWAMILPDGPSKIFPLRKLLPELLCAGIWKYVGRNLRKICCNALRERRLREEQGTFEMTNASDVKDVPLCSEVAFYREHTRLTINEMLSKLGGHHSPKMTLCYAHAAGNPSYFADLGSDGFAYVTGASPAKRAIQDLADALKNLMRYNIPPPMELISLPCEWDNSWMIVREFRPSPFSERAAPVDEENDQLF